MKVPTRLVMIAALALTSACAAQHEEPVGDFEAKSASDRDGAPVVDAALDAPADADAEVEAAPSTMPEFGLAELEQALASNEAKLRELGVALPGAALAGGAETKSDKSATTPPRPSINPGGGMGSSTMPAAEPSEKKSRSEKDKPKPKPKPKDRKRKDQLDDDLGDGDDRFAQPPPDQAKAGPPPTARELDATTRCQRVCELGQITCELSEQICELAERHEGEDDYEAACERSVEDCAVAQEACNACQT